MVKSDGPMGHLRSLRQELEASEDEGYFGPGSAAWCVNQEGILTLGLARALLLQIAHPWVAQAVVDHSSFHQYPFERLLATGRAAELLVFGSRSQADGVIARIKSVHRHINGRLQEDVGRWPAGTRYTAEDPEALMWVLATMLDTTLLVWDRFIGPMREDLERAYLRESRLVAKLMGIPVEWVPPTGLELRQYMRGEIDRGTVAVGQAGRRLAHDLLTVQPPARLRVLWGPARSTAFSLAAHSMPLELRAQFGLTVRKRDTLLFHLSSHSSRAVWRRLPLFLRVDPVTRQALIRSEVTANGQAA